MKIFGLVFIFFVFAVVVQAQDVDALMQTANSLKDQPEKAVEILNEALAADPNSEEALKARAEAYENLKQYDKSIADYQKLVQLSPDEEILWYLLGRSQYNAGQYQDALKSLNHATKLNPQYLPAFHIKIRALLALNKNEEALKVSDSTLNNIGETAMNYFLQGEVNKRMNARQKAEWAYARAAKIDKGFIEAYIALADLFAGVNKPEEIFTNADAALAINPDSEEALIARSRGYALLKQYNDAIEDVSYVIKLNPANLTAYYWRGKYYLGNNKPQDALKDFNHVLQIEPDNWQALAGRADSYAAMGDKSSALANYQAILEKTPKYPEKDAIIQFANQRLFELNRENHAPVVELIDPEPDKFDISVPDNQNTITIKGRITDESPIGKLVINGQVTPVTAVGGKFEFAAVVKLDNITDVNVEVADVYDNVNKLTYHIVRNETGKPQVALFTPKPSDKGTIILAPDNTTSLYVEGKVTDESAIASILVDGKAVDFDQNITDPAFSTIVDISNKTRFSVVVTDRYGNTTEQVYTLEKIAASTPESSTPPTLDQIPAVEKASQ